MSQEQAITVTSKATASLDKVASSVAKAVADLQSVAEVHGDLLGQVAEAQQNLNQIQEDTQIAVRKSKVELDLQVTEHADGVLQNLLTERGLTAIDDDALVDLRHKADRTSYEVDVEIKKAVNAALAKKETEYKLEQAEVNQTNAVRTAQMESRIESLEQQLAASRREVDNLTEQLSAEREAGTERARAAGSMTINAGGK
jgi:hypothetical protein